MSAHTITLDLPKPGVAWRVAIASHTASGRSYSFYLDIVYLGASDVLVKVRIARCGCFTPLSSDGEVLPGEKAALGAISKRLPPTPTDS